VLSGKILPHLLGLLPDPKDFVWVGVTQGLRIPGPGAKIPWQSQLRDMNRGLPVLLRGVAKRQDRRSLPPAVSVNDAEKSNPD